MTEPAGWYVDPWDPDRDRYWDGAAWTGHVHPPEDPSDDPPDVSAQPAARASWFARRRVLTAVVVLGATAVVTAVVLAFTGSRDVAAPTRSPEPTSASTADQGWVLQSFEPRAGSLGLWTGRAQVTNTADELKTAMFSFTLMRGGQPVAVLRGSAREVAPGSTATVDLVSPDRHTPGEVTWAFRVEASF